MTVGLALGLIVAAAMLVVATVGWIRWGRLDRGGRWLVVAVSISAGFLPGSLWMALTGRSTRLLHELEMLLETAALLVAFAWWQPNERRRRGVRLLLPGFMVLWAIAQWIQGLEADFSYVSAPVAGLLKIAVAGYTLVGRVQSARERWTDHLWFWAATGIMVIYGTGVILDPLWFQVFRVRDDLALAAFAVNVTGNAIGYLLIARGLWRLRLLS